MTYGHVIAFSTPQLAWTTHQCHIPQVLTLFFLPFPCNVLHQPKWMKLLTRNLVQNGQSGPVGGCSKTKCWQEGFLSFCQELGGLTVEVNLALMLQMSMI